MGIELGVALRISNARRAVLARVSGLVFFKFSSVLRIGAFTSQEDTETNYLLSIFVGYLNRQGWTHRIIGHRSVCPQPKGTFCKHSRRG